MVALFLRQSHPCLEWLPEGSISDQHSPLPSLRCSHYGPACPAQGNQRGGQPEGARRPRAAGQACPTASVRLTSPQWMHRHICLHLPHSERTCTSHLGPSYPPPPGPLTLLSRKQIAGCADDPHQKKGVVISEKHPQQVMSLRYRKSGSSLFITRGHLVLPQFMCCSWQHLSRPDDAEEGLRGQWGRTEPSPRSPSG